MLLLGLDADLQQTLQTVFQSAQIEVTARDSEGLEIASLLVGGFFVGFFAWYAVQLTYDSWRFHDMAQGVRGCDVVIMLRLQNERMSGALLPSSQEFFKRYGLTQERLALAKPDAIVMHPGPINRGVEIDSDVVDGKQSVILPQVTFGIAVRMAVMGIVAHNVREAA